jgi:hypothetical protein
MLKHSRIHFRFRRLVALEGTSSNQQRRMTLFHMKNVPLRQSCARSVKSLSASGGRRYDEAPVASGADLARKYLQGTCGQKRLRIAEINTF